MQRKQRNTERQVFQGSCLVTRMLQRIIHLVVLKRPGSHASLRVGPDGCLYLGDTLVARSYLVEAIATRC